VAGDEIPAEERRLPVRDRSGRHRRSHARSIGAPWRCALHDLRRHPAGAGDHERRAVSFRVCFPVATQATPEPVTIDPSIHLEFINRFFVLTLRSG